MNYLFRGFFIVYAIVRMVTSNSMNFIELAILLAVTASMIYREKYDNHITLIILEAVLIGYGCSIDNNMIMLLGLCAYDVTYIRAYIILPVLTAGGLYFLDKSDYALFTLIILLCIYFAYVKAILEKREELYRKSYDTERQYRYELEQVKAKLLNSTKEVAHLTEIKERNRIARDIHDNVGHSIAGILMQLQVVSKLYDKDTEKSKELLSNSVDGLSDTLVVLRETVHNIKPKDNLGIGYINSIIENFLYCPIEFKYTGDIDKISPSYMEILYTNIKEALTNVSKYSKASKVIINLDVYEKFIRLYIKDNGTGCGIIREGLGLSGMKERVENIGGSISIDGSNGFLIVCILPQAAAADS